MTCKNAIERLELACLESKLKRLDDDVHRHLADCPSCRLQMDLMTSDLDAPVESSVRDSVRVAVRNDRITRRRTRRIYAVAALIPICIVIFVGALTVVSPAAVPNKAFTSVNWTPTDIDGQVAMERPLVAGNHLILLEKEARGKVLTIRNSQTEHRVWRSKYMALSTPAIRGDTLVIWQTVNDAPTLCAYRNSDGKELWFYKEANRSRRTLNLTKPMVSNDLVCWTVGHRIITLDATTGKALWERTLAPSPQRPSQPVIFNGKVHVADGQAVMSFAGKDGSDAGTLPYLTAPTQSIHSPKVGICNGHVMVLQNHGSGGRLMACDVIDTRVRWSSATRKPRELWIDETSVFVRSTFLEAFDGVSGRAMWSNTIDGCSPLAIAEDLIYVVKRKEVREVAIYSARTGRSQGTIPIPGGSCSGLTLVDRQGYLTTHDGKVFRTSLN